MNARQAWTEMANKEIYLIMMNKELYDKILIKCFHVMQLFYAFHYVDSYYNVMEIMNWISFHTGHMMTRTEQISIEVTFIMKWEIIIDNPIQ